MLGMINDNVESVKFIGRREINMNANMKALFDESDKFYFPYFNDAKELIRILIWIYFRGTTQRWADACPKFTVSEV